MIGTAMTDYSDYQNEKVVEISSPQKSMGKASIIIFLLLFLLVVGLLSLSAGYFFGKATATKPEVKKTTVKAPAAPVGKDVYFDSDEGYSVTYLKAWKAEGKNGTTAGVVVKKDSSSVELSIGTEQSYTLSKDQKSKLSATKKVDVTINGKTLSMSEYSFKDSSFITSATLPATTNSPQVSILIKAENQESYDQAKEIVQSLTFL
ncbi:MAG TPA: hypothetical protein VLE47_00330 [Candidatus Saccharimonadales bacterium]|nr:hypothetical protein [Candidatus Saccharimonadales bacterium]